MNKRYISEAVVRRLPRYYRQVKELHTHGVERVSSAELSKHMDQNASQIRQDFNCFGGFGQQGYGYHVNNLNSELKRILGLDREYNMVIVGGGNIGQALANYAAFFNEGFLVKAVFDIDPGVVGRKIGALNIMHMDDFDSFMRANHIDIGIVATQMGAAQEIVDKFVSGGVKGIWNFAPVDVKAPIPVENVHLNDGLYVLAYRINS